ncbi:MAG: hypothetical protein DI585_01705 [Pseudomonas fluorescens]|nr:MAG: hypothetical protein DI585_01705 [Pseudomonas fluorescens]
MLHSQLGMPPGIRAIIYDIDNCLAPLSNDDITIAWDPYLATEFGLTLEEAIAKRKSHFEAVGCTLTGYAQEYGRDKTWINQVYADTGHASGKRFVERYAVPPRKSELFDLIATKNVQQAFITQGHPHHYDQIVNHLGVGKHVPQHLRIDRTHTVYEKLEDDVWHIMLQHLGLRPHEVIVFEDTPRNLNRPGALGIHTLKVGDRAEGTSAGNIHYRFETALDGLEALYPHL